MSDKETWSGRGVVCPHCQYLHKDTCDFEYDDDAHEFECHDCQKPFKYWTHTATTYYADVLEAANEQ